VIPLRAWFLRVAGLMHKDRRDRDLSVELESHLQFHIEDNLRRGMNSQEARRQALVVLGGIEPAKEAYRARRGLPFLDTLWQDLRFSLRALRKNPGFAAIGVLTLAVGLGANTAIFSVVDAVLLRPLPFHEPDRLVGLWQTNSALNSEREAVSPANFLDWREGVTAFEDVVAMCYWSFDYTGKGEPENFSGELVTKDFFRLMGVTPQLGRAFLAEEYEPGHEHVALLSHGLWQRRFGGDPGIVGQTISLRDESYTVVGVLPADFHLQWLGQDREVFAPMPITPQLRQLRTANYLDVLARLKPGVTLEQARASLAATAVRLAKEYPTEDGSVGVSILPLAEELVGRIRPMLLLVAGAVGLVLLVVCANIANLLLVRGSQRGRELAIRVSLGAARWRVVRQLLTEALTLGVLGCTGGLLLARGLLKFIVELQRTGIPRLEQAGMDWQVMAFGAALSLVTALLAGLAPALHLSRGDLQSAMRRGGAGSRGGSRQGLKGFFVISEVALALTLLAGAGLLLRSLVNLLRVDPGYAREHIAVLQVYVWNRYSTPAQRAQYFEEAVRRVASVPGVEAAGAASSTPLLLGGPDESSRFSIEGHPPVRPDRQPTAIQTVATPGYFHAMGIPLLRGRLLNAFDTAESLPVVVINRTMAQRYWPGEDPIGRRITVEPLFRGAASVTCEIVGIVGDTHQWGPEERPGAEFFRPHTQDPTGSMAFVVRAGGNPSSMLKAVKDAIWSVNNKVSFYGVQTLVHLEEQTLANRRLSLLLLGAFAALAVALAAMGIYGVISYSTAQRTQEIGIRMALGAQRSQVAGMIVGEGLRMALAGVAAGLALALLLMRLLAKMLFGVGAADPLTFAGVIALLLSVALAACYLPARRATRVDPLVALRYE
jgi:putative ABC transport system permease protein